MDNWFTIEQIDRDTFSISEYKHWEETHCYLLCGEKCAILIDTGLGVSNIRKIVDSLTELPVMAITTHVHWDHIGGHMVWSFCLSSKAELQEMSDECLIGNVIQNDCDIQVRVVSRNKPNKNAVSLPPTMEDLYLFYFQGGDTH